MSTVYVVLLWLGGSLSVVTTECGPPSFSRLKSCLSTRMLSQLSTVADARAARSDSSSLTCILGTVTELHAGAKMIVVFRDGGVAVELRDGGDRLKTAALINSLSHAPRYSANGGRRKEEIELVSLCQA